MLTGHLPQPGNDGQAIMRARISEDPLPPTYFVPALDPALAAVVTRAIARAPSERFQTARELLVALHDPGAALAQMAASDPIARRSVAMPAVVIVAVLLALFSVTWASRPAPPASTTAPAAHEDSSRR
jgi:hypothetical protein